MSGRLIILPEAQRDLAEGFDWYERQRQGLGLEFLRSVEAGLETLRRTPLMHPAVHGAVRRAVLRRFPFCLFYFLEDQDVFVLAVFHARRDPRQWRRRAGE